MKLKGMNLWQIAATLNRIFYEQVSADTDVVISPMENGLHIAVKNNKTTYNGFPKEFQLKVTEDGVYKKVDDWQEIEI